MTIAAIIKASNISNNFPDRYKAKIAGKHLLEYMVDRIITSKFVDTIALATTDDAFDDELVEMAKNQGLKVFRGPYKDSLGRIYGAARIAKADVIIKILGNYPFVDPLEIDKMTKEFLTSNYVYGYNEHCEGIVMGLGAEIFTYDLIEKANSEIIAPSQRCFGTNIFKSSVNLQDTLIFTYPESRPSYRITLAVPMDMIIINQIVEECDELYYQGIVRYLDNNPVIVKYAQQNIYSYEEAGLEKVLLFPDKIRSISKHFRSGIDFSYPVSVELSLTNRCNLRCYWCSDSDLRKRSMTDIDFHIVKELFKDLAENGTRGIVIEGGGEPTIYPKFIDVLRCAKDYGLNLGLITNGARLTYENNINCFDWIRVSLDAANRNQFLEGKGSDLFDTVISNIEKIANHKDRNGLVVGVGYVLTKNNEDNLEYLVLNLHNIDVDYIQIRPVIDHPELMPKNTDLSYLVKHSTSKFTVYIHNMNENMIKGNGNLPCRAHSLSTVIAANGDVYLCGRLNRYDWVEPIGSLNDQSFNDIWLGQERIRQAQTVLNREFCLKWCPECRMTKYNILFENTAKIKTNNFI